MLSENQIVEKEKKILIVVKSFLEGNKTIGEVAKETRISSSSVGRYLNDKEYITILLGCNVYNAIQEKLKTNKEQGLSKGGKTSQKRYIPLKDSSGKYCGNIKK